MIDLGKITQGERGTLSITWEFPDKLSSPASISGATITATMTDEYGETTAVSGTLTGTAATTCTWALSAGDSGTAGTFTVLFKAVAGGVTTYTLQATLEVITNPAVTGTQNDPLVSIPSDEAAWLTTSVGGGDLGSAAYQPVAAFDAAGSAAAAQAAAVQRANHTGTQLAATISDFGTAWSALFGSLPSTEPATPGTVWNDAGTVKVSLKPYWYHILYDMLPLAYWPMAEPSGTIAMEQVNAAQNGTYGAVTVGQTGIGDGNTAVAFNGTTSSLNVYTTTFRDAFNDQLGSIAIWGKVASAGEWIDSTIRYLFYLAADAQNYITAFKSSVANTIQVRYRAGNVTKSVDITTSTTDWFSLGVTWDKANDRVKVYFNGAQAGSTQTGLGTWAGDLAAITTAIGRYSLNNNVWTGSLAHCAVWDEELVLADFADLHNFAAYGGTAPVPFELLDVGYMGGSITYGTAATDPFTGSWRAKLGAWWGVTLENYTVTNHMSAISGQGSWNNLVRLQTEIVDYNCGVLFLDGAVNDSIEDDLGTHEGGLYGAAEALIRRAATGLPNARIIVWIFTWPENYSHINANQIAARDKWLALASHYGLQVLRWDQYIESLVGTGYTDADVNTYLYADGNVHPNDAGHLAAYQYAIANLSDISGNVPATLPDRLHASSVDFEYTPISRYGTDNDNETGTGWSTISTTGRQSNTAGDTIAWSGTFSSFGLKTNIGVGAGTLRYKVDAGSWVTLNLSLIGGSSYVVTSFPRGAHTIIFEVVSGLVRFNEFMAI